MLPYCSYLYIIYPLLFYFFCALSLSKKILKYIQQHSNSILKKKIFFFENCMLNILRSSRFHCTSPSNSPMLKLREEAKLQNTPKIFLDLGNRDISWNMMWKDVPFCFPGKMCTMKTGMDLKKNINMYSMLHNIYNTILTYVIYFCTLPYLSVMYAFMMCDV